MKNDSNKWKEYLYEQEIWSHLNGHHVVVKGGARFYDEERSTWIITERLSIHKKDGTEEQAFLFKKATKSKEEADNHTGVLTNVY